MRRYQSSTRRWRIFVAVDISPLDDAVGSRLAVYAWFQRVSQSSLLQGLLVMPFGILRSCFVCDRGSTVWPLNSIGRAHVRRQERLF